MNLPALGNASRFDGLRARAQRLAAQPALAAGWTFARRITPSGAVPLVLYGLYTAVLFAVFVAATFPHEAMLRGVLETAATAPVAVEIRGVRLGWTLGYTIDELRLLRRGADPGVPLLAATDVGAAPSLLGLLHAQPFPLAFQADLYGGTLDGMVDLRPDAFAVRASLANVDITRYPGLRLFMEGTLRGRIDGSFELAGNTTRPTSTAGRVDLRVVDLALEGGKVHGFTSPNLTVPDLTVPDLHFPEVRLEGVVKSGRLDLGDVSARGREVSVRGGGNVLLQYPLAASLLNLDFTLTPAADLPDNLRLELSLIVPGEPGANGERHLHVSGTLDQPRTTK